MALSRITVWIPGQILTASNLNGEFDNVLNHPISLISPTTGPINFNNQAHTNFRLENLAVAPAAANAGRVYYNTGLNRIEIDDGALIRGVPTLRSTDLKVGDLITVTTAGAFTRVGIGSSGQVLTVSSSNGVPAWAAVISSAGVLGTILTSQGGTGQDFSTAVSGAIPYFTSVGTMGVEAQVQTSQGGTGKDLSGLSTGALIYMTSSGGFVALPLATSSYRTLLAGTTGPMWSTQTLAYADPSANRIIVGSGGSEYIAMGGQVRCDFNTNSRFVLPVGTNLWAT
jgi:hypothetical protein